MISSRFGFQEEDLYYAVQASFANGDTGAELGVNFDNSAGTPATPFTLFAYLPELLSSLAAL